MREDQRRDATQVCRDERTPERVQVGLPCQGRPGLNCLLRHGQHLRSWDDLHGIVRSWAVKWTATTSFHAKASSCRPAVDSAIAATDRKLEASRFEVLKRPCAVCGGSSHRNLKESQSMEQTAAGEPCCSSAAAWASGSPKTRLVADWPGSYLRLWQVGLSYGLLMTLSVLACSCL